jgi:hypothetical protein
MIPGASEGAGWLPIDHGLPQLGDGPAPCPASDSHHGFTRMIVDGAQAIPLGRLPGGAS